MPIFKDNYFTNDTYLLRLERLKILHNYIDDWAGQLFVPASLNEWAKSAYDIWKKTLLKLEETKQNKKDLFKHLKKTDEKTFKYYLKCKRFLNLQFLNAIEMQKNLGIAQRFPRNRNEKFETIMKLISAIKENPEILAKEFVEKLELLYSESERAFKKAHNQNFDDQTDQVAIYQKDSKNLRALYSWALMHWETDQPYLVQLGFAVKHPKQKKN